MSPRIAPLDESVLALESLARGVLAGAPPADAQALGTLLDALARRSPSPQVHKMMSVLRASPARPESVHERRRFFHAARAVVTGLRVA